MSKRTCRVLSWTQISMVMLLSYIITPIVVTEDASSLIIYPPQNYLSWSEVGDIPWLINSTNGYNDNLGDNDRICLRSGPIKCGGESNLRIENISGPSIIQFKWKIDAPRGIGQLIFSVDGNIAFECYDRDWTDFSYPLSVDRSHSLEWKFKKIKSYPLWKGAGWIDDINLVMMSLIGVDRSPDQSETNIIINKTSNKTVISNYSEIGQKNLIDAELIIPIQEDNLVSSNKPGSNITIFLQNIIYTYRDSNRKKSSIIIEQKSPKDDEILSNDVDLEFEYEPSNCSRITNCTLLIDNIQKAYSQDLNLNQSNKFVLDKNLNGVGRHFWQIECCECAGLCNSSKEGFFKLSGDSITTYVDPLNPDEARFRYRTISQAASNTSDFGKIIIKNGTYKETIEINKPLTIIGRNKPLLHPASGKDDGGIILVSHNDVNIEGLVLQNSKYGIHISGGKEDKMLNNITIKENDISACSSEIFMEYCKESIIENNSLYNSNRSGCRTGIQLEYCNNITIKFNKFNNLSSQQIGYQRMQTCINMLSCDQRTIQELIEGNHFDFAEKALNLREGYGKYTRDEIKGWLKGHKSKKNNFSMNDTDIIGDGYRCL